MRVLFLAPQPFYQERGTPIAVRLALEALSRKLLSTSSRQPAVDLVVYEEGEEIEIPGVRIIRLSTPKFLRGIRPGISMKKLLCDIFFAATAARLLWQARRDQYTIIHAVEESVFIAWLANKVLGIPYIYDMDSSLALQVTEKWWWCKPLLSLMKYCEGVAVRGSVAVAPVCDALQAIAQRHGSGKTVMLRDVSLLAEEEELSDNRSALFGASITIEHTVILYVGNLESYQGIDLLLEAFARIQSHPSQPRLIIVGGAPEAISHYREKTAVLGCASSVSFLGPRPVASLGALLRSADILASPRTRGNNTPMKIYSYIHSGTALIATDLPTHRQVLDEEIAMLAAPEPEAFAIGLRRLVEDTSLRKRLGVAAKKRALQLYTVEAFERQLCELYDAVTGQITPHLAPTARAVEGS